MDEMFKKYNLQQFIDTFQELLKRSTNKDSHITIEMYMRQITNHLESFANLKYAMDASIIVAATNTRGQIIYANDKFCEISKYSRQELMGKNHRLLNSGYHDPAFFAAMWKTIRKGNVWDGEIKNKAKDGSFYWVKTTIVPIKDPTGKPFMYISFRTDITEGKQAQEKLVTALQNDFRFVVNSMNNLIFKITKDEHNNFLYVLNEGKLAYELGLQDENMRSKTPKQVFPSELAHMFEQNYEIAFSGQAINYTYAFNDRQLLTYLSPIQRDGRVVEVIGCITDITDLHNAQEEINFMAFHDTLTNLPNRRKFNDDITEVILNSQENNTGFAVLFLDLDRFKQINDSLGHTIGDNLIKAVSYRLRDVVASKGSIYRFAGDEFIIVFPNIKDKEVTAAYAKEILSIYETPFLLDHSLEIYTTASVGISTFPEHGEDYDTLLKNADTAMYVAKSNGRNSFRMYERAMSQHHEEALLIEQHLRKAIDNDELELHFQPKLDLATGKVNGVEALLRWNHPLLGSVPPNKFIPIAEDTGLIIKLDEWVLEKACEQNKEWNHVYFSSPIKVAVNISPLHFRLPNFSNVVDRVLKKTGLEPSLLEIEITENSFIDNTEECIACLKKLREMNVSVAIDDFGKGYSSLNYLRKFPINSLKIDRAFIQEVAENMEDIAIVKAITYLAHELNLKVVAEGIETQEVISLLKTLGCDEIQGYYISKPLPKSGLEDMISRLNGGQHQIRMETEVANH
ncbi:MAG TPA: EAL domain-containing protein [Bacillus sp. (in: firmicutes)]|nr:EAL domain-containing protein [Bacillus sp. (in: firmicutes)]